MQHSSRRDLFLIVVLGIAAFTGGVRCSGPVPVDPTGERVTESSEEQHPAGTRVVRGFVQTRPGGPLVDTEVAIHEVPTQVDSVDQADSSLADDDLVLGVVLDGEAMAYPIQYLAHYEIVGDRVGETPIAPSW